MNIQTTIAPAADLSAVKTRQQAAWSSGDYAVVGTTLQIVGESLCEAVDLRAGQRVLDVAAGNGNATLAAARRFADVVSTDYVGALLDRGLSETDAAKRKDAYVQFQKVLAETVPTVMLFSADHVSVRSEAVQQLAGETISTAAKVLLGPLLEKRRMGLTVQVDLGPEVYDAKLGNLHPLFQKGKH